MSSVHGDDHRPLNQLIYYMTMLSYIKSNSKTNTFMIVAPQNYGAYQSADASGLFNFLFCTISISEMFDNPDIWVA